MPLPRTPPTHRSTPASGSSGEKPTPRAREGSPDWHPLLCHVLDVVACAERLLLQVRPERLDAMAAALALPRRFVCTTWIEPGELALSPEDTPQTSLVARRPELRTPAL
ncbi:HD domain-containing protein [Sorangium cellulosum]|uniref:HD domain-containing protein n=1 Tax=Sorangium cellulosum TaxID=56 RepID=UPI0030843353